MTRYTLQKPSPTWLAAILLLAIGSVIAGCGSGTLSAGVGSGGTGSYTASLAASATEGYLINAVVFLDTNDNYQLDGNESYAVTGVDGTATLKVTAADMAAYPVVAVAFKGITIDSATMLPVATTYILSAPKGDTGATGSTLINPISTQLRELLETGRYSNLQQAMDALAGHMGLPADINLLAESIATTTPALNAAAKSIAALMWMQADRIMAPGGATPAVEVERYRTMMKLIEDNMTIVSRLNTPENLINLNNNIEVVIETIPKATTVP